MDNADRTIGDEYADDLEHGAGMEQTGCTGHGAS